MSFLKVKRKNEEDPKEALILASKKTKLQEVSKDIPVFKLTSTAVQEQDISNLINKTLAHRHSLQSRTFDIQKIRNKIREENLQHAKRNKLKILNYIRKIDESTQNETVPIIDVSCTTDDEGENQNEYVYDLYYSNECIDVLDPNFNNDFCIHELNEDICTENSMEDDDDLNESEDDPNEENNWRNEYPEETDDSDDLLSHGMKKTYLHSDYSLSSDDYDESIRNDFYSMNRDCKKYDNFDYYDKIASDTESDENNSP